jgi:uncharacterized protein (TIGR02466 family)
MDINLFPIVIKKSKLVPSDIQKDSLQSLLDQIFTLCKKNSWVGESGFSTGEHGLNLHMNESTNWLFDFISNEVQIYWNDLGYANNAKIFLVSSWANKHSQNDTTQEHSHSDGFYGSNHISGVYYFKKPKYEANIELCDPLDYIKRLCPYNNMFGIETISQEIECEQYDLLLFPSWVRHKVSKQISTKERIAISFNYRGVFPL